MSYSKRSEEAKTTPKKTSRTVRRWSDKPLSAKQKSVLAMLAKKAYGVHGRAGLVDGISEADWRREQVFVACGATGLRECGNGQYRAVYAHFQRLSGNEAEAKKTWEKTGRVRGSNERGDTHEERETAREVLRSIIEKAAGEIDDAYVAAIASDQFSEFREHGLAGLRASQLHALVFVIVQRLRKKCPGIDI